ncbi:hypothetical protein DXU02_14005 [Rhizobium leguminosarum]
MACDLEVAVQFVASCNFATRFSRLDGFGVEGTFCAGLFGKGITLEGCRLMTDVSCRRTGQFGANEWN